MKRLTNARLCAIIFLVIGTARNHAFACDNSILGVSDPVAHQMIVDGGVHVADPSHNVGVYAWSDELQQHMLVASYLDTDFLFSPPEPQLGDVVEYFDPAGGGAGLNSCQPPTLPPVVVTAPPPPRFIGRIFVRIITFFGGGGGRVTSTLGIPVPNNPANPEYATCTADLSSRLHHAHRDVAPYTNARFAAGRAIRRGELMMVTYDDGGTEVWRAVGGIVSATAYSVHDQPVSGTLKCP